MTASADPLNRRVPWRATPRPTSALPTRWKALLAGFAFALAVVVAHQVGEGFRGDHPAVRRSKAVILAARDVQTAETEAEAAERGYHLTGEPSFLAGIQTAMEALPGSAARLRRLTAPDPDQAPRAEALESIVARRTEHLMHGAELRQNFGPRAARDYVLRPEVRDVDRRIRALSSQIVEAEQARLARR